MGTVDGLRELARHPTWRWWTFGSFLARLPITMTLLALVLLGEEVFGSIALGAQLSGLALLASGVSALWRGRVLDRRELTAGLRRDCLLTALMLVGLVVAAVAEAPTPVLFVLAAAQGIAMAALSGGFRALLPVVVPPPLLARANVIEAVAVEVAFVTGPALAGVLAIVTGPIGVLVAMAVSVGLGGVIAARLPALHPPAQRAEFAPWRVPGVRPVLLLALALGFSVGMLESLVPPRVVVLGWDAEAAGPLLALLALGSGVGGILASARAETMTDVRRPAAVLLLVFGLLLAPTAVAPTVVLLGVVLLIAGMPIAPLNAMGTLRLQTIVPAGRQAEGFSLYLAAVMLGAGAGQSLVGQLLDVTGPEVLLVAATAPPIVSAVVVAVVTASSSKRAARSPGVDPAR